MRQSIENHEGNKYLRKITSPLDGTSILVDVYAVLEAFNVTCQPRGHAIKKLLCTGLRNKGTELEDLLGALAAVNRAIDLQTDRMRVKEEKKDDKENTNI